LIEPHLEPPAERRPLWSRLGWMLLIWAASIAFLGVIALLIRSWIGA
jgi:hypothetical protein